MADWEAYVAKVIHGVERRVDRVKYRLERRFGREPLVVLGYLGYGTTDRLHLKGRVLEDKGLGPADPDASLWRNLREAVQRFESDEVPFAEVEVRCGAARRRVVADEEGFFDLALELAAPEVPERVELREVEFELLSPRPENQAGFVFGGAAVVPGRDARFGVISDMDDTVLQTGATSLVSMARKTLFGNSRTRLPFEGVAGFYRALHADRNPIFYVSSSPWNLYDVLVEFLELNDVPVGPVMLRDWGVTETDLLPTDHGEHKHAAIEGVLDAYPDLPFVLIGDSGQEDPEIYREVVARNPGRVLGIYIRDVTATQRREEEIARLAAEVAEDGVPLVRVEDTVAAAEHAAAQGWIDPAEIADVRDAKAEDEAAPPV